MVIACIAAVVFGLLTLMFLSIGIKNILSGNYTKGSLFFILNIVTMITPLFLVAVISVKHLPAYGITLAATIVVSSFAFFLYKQIKKR